MNMGREHEDMKDVNDVWRQDFHGTGHSLILLYLIGGKKSGKSD